MDAMDISDTEDIENLDLERFEENEDAAEEGGGEEQEAAEGNEDEEAGDATKKAVKPKRVVRNPQPKLNADTLKGKRGLIALESYFERVKYKGRGHEEEDLSVILKTYEYWCHRLFPKYPFDECIAKIENLGKKKPVVTYIKRLRADLPYDCGPELVTEENNESDNENVTNDPNDQVNVDFDNFFGTPEPQMPEINEEQLERIRLNKERAENIRREKLRQAQELSEAGGSQSQHDLVNVDFDNFFETPEPQIPEISEEQLEKIRLNKERAENIRREKLRKAQELSEAGGSQSQHLLPGNDNTESLSEEAASQNEFLEPQVAEPSNSEATPQVESRDLDENCSPQVHPLISDNDDLEVNVCNSQMEAEENFQNQEDFVENSLNSENILQLEQNLTLNVSEDSPAESSREHNVPANSETDKDVDL